MIPLIKPHFSQLSMEVQPLEMEEYKRLQGIGLDGVLVYQETYRRTTYLEHHLRGNKSNFNYRLDAPDRIGQAGIHKIGLGVLLGLGRLAHGFINDGASFTAPTKALLAKPL